MLRIIVLAVLLALGWHLAEASEAQKRVHQSVIKSLSTKKYGAAAVVISGNHACLTFNTGKRLDLKLLDDATEEAEELIGVDENNNYWAIYIDWTTPSGKTIPSA